MEERSPLPAHALESSFDASWVPTALYNLSSRVVVAVNLNKGWVLGSDLCMPGTNPSIEVGWLPRPPHIKTHHCKLMSK
jgi:hypothetical protein